MMILYSQRLPRRLQHVRFLTWSPSLCRGPWTISQLLWHMDSTFLLWEECPLCTPSVTSPCGYKLEEECSNNCRRILYCKYSIPHECLHVLSQVLIVQFTTQATLKVCNHFVLVRIITNQLLQLFSICMGPSTSTMKNVAKKVILKIFENKSSWEKSCGKANTKNY